MKRLITGLFVMAIILLPMPATAKTTYRYTTQTVSLKESVTGAAVRKVKKNTKCTLVQSGKQYARIKYKGKAYYCKAIYLSNKKAVKKYTGAQFKWLGVVKFNGVKYTWYSQRVLPGRGLKIPGRHLDGQGFVCDSKGYIVLGSSTSNRGKIVPTPFGRYGKVYDAGCGGSKWFDCYVGW